MPRITCPQCQTSANLPDDYRHPHVQCPKCKSVFDLADLLLDTVAKPVTPMKELRPPETPIVVEPAEPEPGISLDFSDVPREYESEASELPTHLYGVREATAFAKSCKSTGIWLFVLSFFLLIYALIGTIGFFSPASSRRVEDEFAAESTRFIGLIFSFAALILGFVSFNTAWDLFRVKGPKFGSGRLITVGVVSTILGTLSGLVGVVMMLLVAGKFLLGTPNVNPKTTAPVRQIGELMMTVYFIVFGVVGLTAGIKTFLNAARLGRKRRAEWEYVQERYEAFENDKARKRPATHGDSD